MKYTDNTKGFRRRNIITKLDALLQDILYYKEYIEDIIRYEEDINDDDYKQWVYELEDYEHYYSCVRTTYCLLLKGSRVSKHDLIYCNEISKMLPGVRFK